LIDKVENLSNEKELLWKDKIIFLKEIELLKNQLSEKNSVIDQLMLKN